MANPNQSQSYPGSLLVEDVITVTGQGHFPMGTVQGVLHCGDAVEVLRGDQVLLRTVILGFEFLNNRNHPHWIALRLEGQGINQLQPGDIIRVISGQ